jgi:hypothetical protein
MISRAGFVLPFNDASAIAVEGSASLQGFAPESPLLLTGGGSTDFALHLTPAQPPAGIQLAGLYLTASVVGRFSVRASGRLKACAFDVAWTLSIRLPGGHSRQSILIARQQPRVEREGISSSASVTLADLITIDGDVRLDQLKLGLKLVWQDSQLGIKVTQTGAFYPFDSLPPLSLLPGETLVTPLRRRQGVRESDGSLSGLNGPFRL